VDETAKHEGEAGLPQALVKAILRLADEIDEIKAQTTYSDG
jgi:hypothetical protein